MKSRVAENRVELIDEIEPFAVTNARVQPEMPSRFDERNARIDTDDTASAILESSGQRSVATTKIENSLVRLGRKGARTGAPRSATKRAFFA